MLDKLSCVHVPFKLCTFADSVPEISNFQTSDSEAVLSEAKPPAR